MQCFAVYVKEGLPWNSSRDLFQEMDGTYSKTFFRILIRFRLALLHSVTFINSLYRSPSSSFVHGC